MIGGDGQTGSSHCSPFLIAVALGRSLIRAVSLVTASEHAADAEGLPWDVQIAKWNHQRQHVEQHISNSPDIHLSKYLFCTPCFLS